MTPFNYFRQPTDVEGPIIIGHTENRPQKWICGLSSICDWQPIDDLIFDALGSYVMNSWLAGWLAEYAIIGNVSILGMISLRKTAHPYDLKMS